MASRSTGSTTSGDQIKIELIEEIAEHDLAMHCERIRTEELTYEKKLENVSVIAKPMASENLTKKCCELIQKAQQKSSVRNGLRDVQTRIKKGETGILLFAGDVTPVESMCHLPGVCEDKNIPYCYIPSKSDIGNALGYKRGVLMVLILEHVDYKDVFTECKDEITNLAVRL